MSTPIIGVAWPQASYLSALERAGAIVRALTPADDVRSALAQCDGLLLTGGADVDPARYGVHDRHPTVKVDPERDAYETALVLEALTRDMPLLAICRGVQILNVAAGGSLFQDLPSEHPSATTHSIKDPKDTIAHGVSILPTTVLAGVLNVSPDSLTPIGVNSRHHQAVRTVAPGFVVSATAPDDVVEAIERPEACFCVGVQWHPEDFGSTNRFGSLFTGLVDAARRTGRRA